MNIFVTLVSCMVMMSCSDAVPNSKHKHKNVPLSKMENTNYPEATALQILEEHLLSSNNNLINKGHLVPTQRSRARSTFNSCFAAFGKLSPLCHSKRKSKNLNQKSISKRYITRPFSPMKRLSGRPRTDRSVVDDFFSIFVTNQSTPFSEMSSSKSSSIISNFTSPLSILDQFKPSFENSEALTVPCDKVRIKGKFLASFENRNKFGSIGDILPHNRSSRSHTNNSEVIFLEHFGEPRQNVTTFSNESQKCGGTDTADLGSASSETSLIPYIQNPVLEVSTEANHSVESSSENYNSVFEMLAEDSHLSKLPEDHNFGPDTVPYNQENLSAVYNSDVKIRELHENISKLTAMDKDMCETFYKKNCICSFSHLEKDIRDIFHSSAHTKTIYHEISQIHCNHYSPKPEEFRLTSQLKPKVLSANRKPMTVDRETGPKEIEPTSLDQFIRESASVDDDVLFVFVNTDVSIPCFPTNDVHLSASDADHVKYKWSRGGKPITDGRMVENSDGDGTLSIDDTTLTDSGIYTCEVDYINPDTGQHTEDTFSHNVSVVTLPIVTVRVSVHYIAAASCDASLLEEFQLYLPQLVEETLCESSGSRRLCSVEVHNPVCNTRNSADSERSHREVATNSSKKRNTSWLQEKIEGAILKESSVDTLGLNSSFLREKREASMEMSLNLEVYVHRTAEKDLSSSNTTLCDATCHMLITFKLLQTFKENMQQIILTPVTSLAGNGITTFTPLDSSVGLKYIFGCIGGYYLNKGFCSACPKHTFSEDGATECSPCPAHTYQGSLGARKCIPCSHAWVPACNEYFEDLNYIIIVLVVVLVSILLAGFILWYLLVVRKKNFADMGRKLIPKTGTKRKVKAGKSQKRVRRHDIPIVKISQSSVTVDELQELINSSPDETDDLVDVGNVKSGSQRRSRR